MNSYETLAEKLDALPNGYPPTEDGAHLRLLEKIFTPQEAEMAAQLNAEPEPLRTIAERVGREPKELRQTLKEMAKRGLITIKIKDRSDHYGLMPFVVGIYEYQAGSIDKEMAELFEDYYQKAFVDVMRWRSQGHII